MICEKKHRLTIICCRPFSSNRNAEGDNDVPFQNRPQCDSGPEPEIKSDRGQLKLEKDCPGTIQIGDIGDGCDNDCVGNESDILG